MPNIMEDPNIQHESNNMPNPSAQLRATNGVDTMTRIESTHNGIATLAHASQCLDTSCSRIGCQRMKQVVQHTRVCRNRTNGGCLLCKKFDDKYCFHAKHCESVGCPVPFCMEIRQKNAKEKRSEQSGEPMPKRRRVEVPE